MEMKGFVDGGVEGTFMGTGFLTENYKFVTCAHNIRQLYDKKAKKSVDLTATQIKLYFGLSDTLTNREPDVILCEEDINRFYIPEAYRPTNPDDFASIDLSSFKNDLPSQHFYLGAFSKTHHELCGKRK